MSVERKNFSGKATPGILADEYRNCNFSQPTPGTRIFPGDDTPRRFWECNLVNAIPPPGSTLERCNTTIVVRNVQSGVERVTIGGRGVDIQRYVDRIEGRLNAKTLEPDLKPVPVEVEVDPPEGSRDLRLKRLVQERDAAQAEAVAREAEADVLAREVVREVIR